MKSRKELYVTSGMVQSLMNHWYHHKGEKKNFVNVINEIYESGRYLTEKPRLPLDYLWNNLTDEEFVALLFKLPISINKLIRTNYSNYVLEDDLLPSGSDVFAFKHFNYTDNNYHMHDYFEIGYVFQGSCLLKFEKEEHVLHEGELFIVAPMSVHDIIVDDDNSIILMTPIRKSTFENSFFTLLTQQDLLSGFFRTILYSSSTSNYLLFFTDNSKDIKSIFKNLFMENYKEDIYFNHCCISWIDILFSLLLRNYSSTIRFHCNNAPSTSFPLILQYIQQNYKTLSLKSLAEVFHYSDAHLSTLIKQNTGMNLTVLINKLKLSKAVEYLKNTTLPLADIAEYAGYRSEDYFSRTFKKYYQISPQKYRIQMKQTDN